MLVTGAAGGVGSVAIALLAKLGYQVIASTGRPSGGGLPQGPRRDGDHRPRRAVGPGRPLGKERWAGVVDAVGSHTLANAIVHDQVRRRVAACGLAQGMDLPASVAPFILRGVTLAGIDSVMAPKRARVEAWSGWPPISTGPSSMR